MALDATRVLYISYTGMLDPLGQSQVLPYLFELSKRGVRFTVLSYERQTALAESGEANLKQLSDELAAHNIEWHWLRYHQTPSLPATAFDVAAGIRLGRRLMRENRINLLHARSHIPATIALALKKQTGVKMIFDVRGLMAEEYVDANHWREGSVAYRITKAMERRILNSSDGLVVLTEKVWPVISGWEGLKGRSVAYRVIPCCIDLERFKFNEQDRERRRNELGLGNRFTLVYSGSIGSWYLSDRMADFFVELVKLNSDAYFLWLTQGDPQIIVTLMSERGFSERQFAIKKLTSVAVPSYLSAADAGIAFYKPGFSKLATSPVKVSEYLAAGLPLVINAGVGDSDELSEVWKVAAIVNDFSTERYALAVSTLQQLVNQIDSRQRMRIVAEKLFDLQTGSEQYAQLYDEVLAQN